MNVGGEEYFLGKKERNILKKKNLSIIISHLYTSYRVTEPRAKLKPENITKYLKRLNKNIN